MISIPAHIESLKSYNPGKTQAEYQKLYGFQRTASLWNNENNLGVPIRAVERIQSSLSKINLYPDPLSSELRSKLALLNRVEAKNIVVGNGSESILNNLFKVFCAPGEEILTCSGTFVAVYIWAQSNNNNSLKIPLSKGYSFDLEAIHASINSKTKIIYISNANNPTGTAIGEAELLAFAKAVPENILVIIDEAYFEYSKDLMQDYPDTSRWKMNNVITLRTFSKAYGLAGVRLGYAIGEENVIESLNKVRMTFEPSILTQEAGIGALEDVEFLEESIKINSEWIPRFKQVVDEKGLKQSDSKANFIMIDFEDEEKAASVTIALMKQGVFVRHLPAFGLPECIRVSTGTPRENEYFIEVFSGLSI